MSLILDALNRSRQEQDPPTVPGLSSEHYVPETPGMKSLLSRWLPWLALALALLVILWLLLERIDSPPATPPVVHEAVEKAAMPTLAPQPEMEPIPQLESRPEPRAEPELQIESAVKPAEDAAIAALYEQNIPGGAAGTASVADDAETGALAEPEEIPDNSVDERPVDIEAMLELTRQQMEESRLTEHSAPFISDLSQQIKDGIPTVYYQRHDYAGSGANSSVVLNGKTLRLGGQAAAGVKVEEILPDSVVLNHQGMQFRLKALNSWINL